MRMPLMRLILVGQLLAPAASRKYLLLSPRVVDPVAAAATGAELVLGLVTKHAANPLFSDAASDPLKGAWEGEYSNLWASVYWDAELDRWRLWYNSYLNCTGVRDCEGKFGLEYAESADGLAWRKPLLNATLFNGSTANNLVALIPVCGTSVLLDAAATGSCEAPGGVTAPCRYKLVGNLPGYAAFAVSGDGIVWSHFSGNSSKKAQQPSIFIHGTHNNVAWSARRQRWVAFERYSNQPIRQSGAVQSSSARFLPAADGSGWGAKPTIITGLVDSSEYNTTEDQLDGLVVLSGETAVYPGGANSSEDVYIGLANMMNLTALTSDIELVWSSDLISWSFIKKGTPLIRRGLPGSHDADQMWAAKQAPHIMPGGERVRLYYAGTRGELFGKPRMTGLNVATMQRDSWAGYTAAGNATAVTFATQEMVFTADAVQITFATVVGHQRALRSQSIVPTLRVGVIGEPALSINRCRPLTGSGAMKTVSWGDGGAAALAKLRGRAVRLELEVQPGMVAYALGMSADHDATVL